jgi:hypothetical protein
MESVEKKSLKLVNKLPESLQVEKFPINHRRFLKMLTFYVSQAARFRVEG